MDELNWTRIAIMAVMPLPIGLLLAAPLWRRGEGLLGNLAGTGVIFATAVVLILKESTELDALTNACLGTGQTDCFPTSDTVARYFVYAFIGLAEVIALFLISLKVERRMRDREYAPEWRSWGRN
jgi:hypothetical protein